MPRIEGTALALRIASAWPAGSGSLRFLAMLSRSTNSPASVADLLPLLARALPQARRRELPDLDHMAPVMDPAAINPLIAGFLEARSFRRGPRSRNR